MRTWVTSVLPPPVSAHCEHERKPRVPTGVPCAYSWSSSHVLLFRWSTCRHGHRGPLIDREVSSRTCSSWLGIHLHCPRDPIQHGAAAPIFPDNRRSILSIPATTSFGFRPSERDLAAG